MEPLRIEHPPSSLDCPAPFHIALFERFKRNKCIFFQSSKMFWSVCSKKKKRFSFMPTHDAKVMSCWMSKSILLDCFNSSPPPIASYHLPFQTCQPSCPPDSLCSNLMFLFDYSSTFFTSSSKVVSQLIGNIPSLSGANPKELKEEGGGLEHRCIKFNFTLSSAQ